MENENQRDFSELFEDLDAIATFWDLEHIDIQLNWNGKIVKIAFKPGIKELQKDKNIFS